METDMTTTDLIEACSILSVNTSYTTKLVDHDLIGALLALQVCLEEMTKAERANINFILARGY